MSLPTRLKVNIRDLWTSPTSAVQTSLASLKSLIGHPINIEPEWPLLWAELGKHYNEDQSRFVPEVAGLVVSWAQTLGDLAEDESNEAWTEEMLEKTKGAGGVLKVGIDVADNQPSTTWSAKHSGFLITLPKSKPLSQTNLAGRFHDDLRHAFKPAATNNSSAFSPTTSTAIEPDDDFTDISPSGILTPTTTISHIPLRPAQPEPFPSLAMLPRPEDLTRNAPYHMSISHRSEGKFIIVHCSHGPSLTLMAEYFKKWAKRNHGQTTKPAACAITLHESAFGLGLVHDRLSMEIDSYDHKHGISPTLVLVFAEQILGYGVVWQDSGVWNLRRDRAWK